MAVDCHVHMLFDGVFWKGAIARHENGADLAWVRQILSAYQRAGFTYLRDGGDRWGASEAARMLSGAYGIVYRTPLAPLCLRGHYGSFIGRAFDDLQEYAQLVRKYRRAGADFIKIMISGLIDFDHYGVLTEPSLDGDMIRALVQIAHDAGFSVMAHANGADAVIAAACAGVDSIEHGAYLNDAALCAMAENGVVWVPTLSTVANLRGKGRYDEEAVGCILASMTASVGAFGALGGLIAPGSDAGAWQVGHAMHTEYKLLGLAGLSDAQIARGAAALIEKF